MSVDGRVLIPKIGKIIQCRVPVCVFVVFIPGKKQTAGATVDVKGGPETAFVDRLFFRVGRRVFDRDVVCRIRRIKDAEGISRKRPEINIAVCKVYGRRKII